jgi:hypothetical protein
MPIFSQKKILLALLGILVILIGFRFFANISFPDSGIVLEKGELYKLLPEKMLSQKFAANRDNLDKIEFLLRTPGVREGDTVDMTLADETCAGAIRKGTLEVPFLNSDNLYVFDFPRIADSNGKQYCITAMLHAGNKTTKYVQFFTTDASILDAPVTDRSNDTAMDGRALSMRPAYVNGSVWQDMRELNQRISQYKPWFLKGALIATVAIFFVVLSIGLIAILIVI